MHLLITDHHLRFNFSKSSTSQNLQPLKVFNFSKSPTTPGTNHHSYKTRHDFRSAYAKNSHYETCCISVFSILRIVVLPFFYADSDCGTSVIRNVTYDVYIFFLNRISVSKSEWSVLSQKWLFILQIVVHNVCTK